MGMDVSPEQGVLVKVDDLLGALNENAVICAYEALKRFVADNGDAAGEYVASRPVAEWFDPSFLKRRPTKKKVVAALRDIVKSRVFHDSTSWSNDDSGIIDGELLSDLFNVVFHTPLSGLIDREGKWEVPPRFDIVLCNLTDGLAVVCEKDGVGSSMGIIDRKGKWVVESGLQFCDDLFVEGMLRVQKDGVYGFISNSGKWAIEPQFEDVENFSDGLARAQKVGVWGFIDRNGKWVIEPQFAFAHSFHENLALAKRDGAWGFINQTGKWVIEPQLENAGNFSNGLASVKKDGAWGFIDQTGKWVVEPQCEDVGSFSDGLASAKKDGAWGFIDQTGKWAAEPQCESVGSFVEGLASAKKDGAFGFINQNGKWAVEPQFEWVHYFSDGLVIAQKGRLRGFIDKSGKWVIEPQFDCALPFHEGLAAVSNEDGVFGYIDKTGKWIIEPQFDMAEEFQAGLAIATAYCCDGIPRITGIQVFGNRSRQYGSLDVEPGIPYFVFSEDDCFVRTETDGGRRLARLIQKESLELSKWASVSI